MYFLMTRIKCSWVNGGHVPPCFYVRIKFIQSISATAVREDTLGIIVSDATTGTSAIPWRSGTTAGLVTAMATPMFMLKTGAIIELANAFSVWGTLVVGSATPAWSGTMAILFLDNAKVHIHISIIAA